MLRILKPYISMLGTKCFMKSTLQQDQILLHLVLLIMQQKRSHTKYRLSCSKHSDTLIHTVKNKHGKTIGKSVYPRALMFLLGQPFISEVKLRVQIAKRMKVTNKQAKFEFLQQTKTTKLQSNFLGATHKRITHIEILFFIHKYNHEIRLPS